MSKDCEALASLWVGWGGHCPSREVIAFIAVRSVHSVLLVVDPKPIWWPPLLCDMMFVLSGGIVSTLPGLSVLDVSCNPKLAQEVDDSGFRELAASLSHTASLTVLRLQGCGLTADCLHSLGRTSEECSWNKGAQLRFHLLQWRDGILILKVLLQFSSSGSRFSFSLCVCACLFPLYCFCFPTLSCSLSIRPSVLIMFSNKHRRVWKKVSDIPYITSCPCATTLIFLK